MVRVLISMRASALGNVRHSRFGLLSLVGTAALGLVTAAATLLLGFTATGSASAGADQLALLALSWTAGRIGFAAFSAGDPAVSLDLFRILPLPRPALARSLLLLGFTDPALGFLAIALASVACYGFRFGVGAGMVGVLGVSATLVLVSFLSTVLAAVAPSGSRRRQDFGTLLAAAVISVVVVLGTLVGPLLSLLSSGGSPILSAVLRDLPTGWAPDAVAAAADGDVSGVVLPLAALAALCAATAAWWPHALSVRLLSQATSARHGHGHRERRLLPATSTGAVVSRELRLWIRDPNRSGLLLIALIVGLGICIVPVFSRNTALLLPFAGIGTAVIAAAVAGNSYGFDGGSLAIVLLAADAERSDVRGRQIAWFLLVGPYTILLSVAGTVIAGQVWATPWVFSLLPAALGGAVGVIPLISLVAPQPLDDNGSIGPTWVVKAYATIGLTALSTAPTLALLIAGSTSGMDTISWLGAPVGILTGISCAAVFGDAAGKRLNRRGPEIFQALARAGNRN